jgi:uncharacterized membrane protein YtjA (UPF0391 family)
MLGWIILFIILAVAFGVLGFTGIASGFASIAKILFFVFLALVIISALSRAFRGRSP